MSARVLRCRIPCGGSSSGKNLSFELSNRDPVGYYAVLFRRRAIDLRGSGDSGNRADFMAAPQPLFAITPFAVTKI